MKLTIWGGKSIPPKLFVKDKISFPLLSMPIETQPKVRILQQWFSEQILPWNLAKQFIGQEKSVLDLIVIGGGKETRKEIINNARVTHAWLGYFLNSYDFRPWPLPEQKELKDKEVWKIHDATGTTYTSIATNDKFDDKDDILNQALVENIGCFTETNIKEILRHMIKDRTYNIDMYTKMVNFKCYKINTAIQLL